MLDSTETPGGCWVHFSVIVTPVIRESPGVTLSEHKSLTVGQAVDLEWEAPGQDGFAFMAAEVRP
ncbi:hypothetical protein [Nocardioides aestuarii]|uniref:DUF35 domain-containing protein n=1 Tax=Nocardioides aestuarii TaxID=252231 RepID=A0ABW4TMM2_9ACTN